MAYVEPKIDWNEAYQPAPEDMNRIEGNTKKNHEDINFETINRISGDSVVDAKVTNTENIITNLSAVL